MSKNLITRILLFSVLIMTLGGVFILAEENPENVAGIYKIANQKADSVKIGEKIINPVDSEDIVNTVVINITGCESKMCIASLNGTSLGFLSEGENNFDFNNDLLVDGENEIRILLSQGNSTYNYIYRYGEYNLDDIVVDSVSVTFGGLVQVVPKEMIKYMPIENSIKATTVRTAYQTSQSVGDGWNNETKLGGSTPNTPIYVGYLIEKPTEEIKYFEVDTTVFEDSIYTINVLNGNNVIESHKIKVDNTAPEINLSFKNGDTIANSNTIKFGATDEMPITLTAKIDNVAINGNSVSLKSYSQGSHNLYLVATDSLGNTSERMFEFTIKQTIPDYELFNRDGSAVLSIPNNASAKIFSVDLIGRINMYTNRLGPYSMKYLRSSDEVLTSFSNKSNITTVSVGNTLPYQSFVIDVGTNTGDAVVSYSGETGSGEDILLQIWNYKTQSWDTLGRTDSGVSISVKADITTYSKEGKMRVKACPYVLSNGSDTLLWLSDTQYYTRFDDLNYLYTDIMKYAKNEYIAGNISYVVNTGDFIDQSEAGDETAHKEFKVASVAQKILDEAMVPNGVVSGNHDIKHTKADYTYFQNYFGSERYEDFEWYGGNYKNNTHHYDLITIGNYDFLFLYLGCYDEANSDTIAWANAILETYPEKNAVICTHEYIFSSGHYSGDRANVIWDKIVVPNDNVKMILCGHNEGAANQLHQVGDSDRYVLEILADYQFAELDNEIAHVLNDYNCDGEGFVRLMTFNEAGQVITTTYSPSADKYNYYPSYIDTFVYDLDLIPAIRSIRTTDFSVGVNINEEGVFGVDKIDLSESDGVYAVINEGDIEYTTEILTIKDKTVTYTVFADTTDYNKTFERFEITGMRGVLASLRHEDSNQKPSEELVEIGVEFLPSMTDKAARVSGSTDYLAKYNENGKYTLGFSNIGSETWITTSLNINKTVDVTEFNRLYFGVTADKNSKWNLYITFSNGKSINFSQDLYQNFGYEDYYVPSDIQGTWQGYFPLEEYVTGEVTVKNVYFVAATSDSTVTFDYFFIGKLLGEEVIFVTDEETEYSMDIARGMQAEVISNPIKNGYIFDGWFSEKEGGEKIEFPAKLEENGLTAYAHFTKKETGADNADKTKYYNDEVEILPGADYKKIIIIWVIALTALAGIVATIVSAIHHKKRSRAS
ncbi:MAG: hypothetical protein A2Y15_03095 [Clostridiales bacterium GWF2_36_10]|nr:MAG: hypothetical protein A2Y15_03095 [Clostridiales bacterium GWF2_36_10]